MLKIKNLVYIKNMENKKRGRPIKYNSEEVFTMSGDNFISVTIPVGTSI